MLILDGHPAEAKLLELVHNAVPREAVGLLTNDGRVIGLPNRAEQPENNFAVIREDILNAIRMHELEDLQDLTLWHSHPHGGVGPSRIDMQQRLPFLNHLVVTVTDTGVVYTWY